MLGEVQGIDAHLRWGDDQKPEIAPPAGAHGAALTEVAPRDESPR